MPNPDEPSNPRVAAVVVTYNRLPLLKECIQALRDQSRKPDEVVVINNGSTDDTKSWLDAQPDLFVVHQANLGGAGGFSQGIKTAFNRGHDFFWIMDDDTIARRECLHHFTRSKAISHREIGFLAGKVVWTDDSLHGMNRVRLQSGVQADVNANSPELIPCLAASFVSIVISRLSVETLGLPFANFFIWCDDIEYTSRLSLAYSCFYVPDAVAVHKTPYNSSFDSTRYDPKQRWKFEYGIRNSMAMRRLPWVNARFPTPAIRGMAGVAKNIFKTGLPLAAFRWAARGLSLPLDVHHPDGSVIPHEKIVQIQRRPR